MRVQLIIGDQVATATLEDNAAARGHGIDAAITLTMHDLFGREKPGSPPRAPIGDVPSVFNYRVGHIAYWRPNHDIAIFYAHDGSSIPSTGLIPLGIVDDGLHVIAAAGDNFQMTIETIN